MNAKEIVSQGILQFIWAVSREKWRFKEGKNEKSLNYEIVSKSCKENRNRFYKGIKFMFHFSHLKLFLRQLHWLKNNISNRDPHRKFESLKILKYRYKFLKLFSM